MRKGLQKCTGSAWQGDRKHVNGKMQSYAPAAIERHGGHAASTVQGGGGRCTRLCRWRMFQVHMRRRGPRMKHLRRQKNINKVQEAGTGRGEWDAPAEAVRGG
jgi:hypothetical protein